MAAELVVRGWLAWGCAGGFSPNWLAKFLKAGTYHSAVAVNASLINTLAILQTTKVAVMKAFPSQPLPNQTSRALAVAWGLALPFVSVGAALLVTLLLQPTLFPTPLFFVAVLVSTWFGGSMAGLVSVLVATLSLGYFFVFTPGVGEHGLQDVVYLAQFSLPALLTCWFVKKRKDAEAALRESRDQLDAKVRERTTELREINERLQAEMVERKRMEEEHQKTKADLEHLGRISTMSALATSIAHEVNQPLAAIVTTGDAGLRWLAAEPPNVARAKDSIARIVEDGNRAGEIVRRIRALSTKTMPQKSVLAVNDVVRDVLSLVDVELRTSGTAVDLELAEANPQVLGDSVQLQQVVLNLVVNALEAMAECDPQNRLLSIRTSRSRDELVCVTVCDSGCGLEESRGEEYFEAFVTTKPKGLGMGLPISRAIVEAHGGKLTASANERGGATFAFELSAAGANER